MDSGPDRRRIPGWVIAVVCIGALLTGAGAAISLIDPALLLAPGEAVTGGVQTYAGYLFSRDLAMAAALLIALGLRRPRLLAAFMALTAAVQILDVMVDAATARWALVPGLTVFAATFAFGASRLVGSGLRVEKSRTDEAHS